MPKTIDKLAWLEIVDKKLLVVRSHTQNVFYMPGGKREAGETDEQALVREIQEELSTTLTNLEYFDTFLGPAHGQPEGTKVKFTCYTGKAENPLTPSTEIAELAYVTSADLPRLSEAAGQILTHLHQNKLVA